MRKAIYKMRTEESLDLLRRAPVVHVATTNSDGGPVLRTVHGVVVDDALAFHGAPAGEKMEGLGQPAVVSAEEIIAQIPSYFVDPERACPATTYYRSVQVHGRLDRVEDPNHKAMVLRALMAKYQPEGGHVPIDPDNALYRKAVRGLLIVRVELERISGKAKLGQNRRPEELARILERLWKRGGPGDLRAIDLVREANGSIPKPDFLASPGNTTLVCAPDTSCVEGAVRLIKDEYWNDGIHEQLLYASHQGSSAWIAAKDQSGGVIATARGLADGGKIGWIFDVAVAVGWRGTGLGSAVMRLLLDHPAMRNVRQIRLATRDAQTFYRRFGFRPRHEVAPWPRYAEMVLEQRAPFVDTRAQP